MFHDNMFRFRDIVLSKPFYESHAGVKRYVSFSEYLIFTIEYDLMRMHNICYLDETLIVEETKECFELTAAVYSYTTSSKKRECRVIVKYGRYWYIINGSGVLEIDFMKSSESIFHNDTLHIVVYKKQIPLNLK
jgi:hypothetical protein